MVVATASSPPRSPSPPLSLLSPAARRRAGSGLSGVDRPTWRLSSPPNVRKNTWEALSSGLPTSLVGRSPPLLLSRHLSSPKVQLPSSSEDEQPLALMSSSTLQPLPAHDISPMLPQEALTNYLPKQAPAPPVLPQEALAKYLPKRAPAPSSPSRSKYRTRSQTQEQHSLETRPSRRTGSSSPSPPRHSARPPPTQSSARTLSGRGSSLVGASARSARSTRRHGAHAAMLDDSGLQSEETPQTTVVSQLCGELRWLRENSTVVSKYDAVLNAKVERMQRLQESRQARRAGETRRQIMARFTVAKSWFVEKFFARNSQLLLATIIAGWMEMASRPRAIEDVIATSCLRALQLYYFFFWRRCVGCQHAAGVVESLHVEMQRFQETEQIQLEEVQRCRAEIEEHSFKLILQALGRSLGTHLDVFRPRVFQAWVDIVKNKPTIDIDQNFAAKSALRLGAPTLCTSMILMEHFCLEAAILRSWHNRVRSKKKAARVNAMMSKALLVMSGSTIKDIMRLVFDNWHWCKTQCKRRMSVDLAESQDSLLMKLFAVKQHSKAIRIKYAEQSMKVFSELTQAGIVAKAFKSWRSTAEQVLVEQRLAWTKQQLREAETNKQSRAILLWSAASKDVELLDVSSLWLHFSIWHRTILEGEPAKLVGALDEHRQLNASLETVQHRVRRQMVSGAAIVIATHLSKLIRVAKHQTIMNLSIGAKRMVAGRLRQDAEVQRQEVLVETRQTLGAFRVQVRQRHVAAAHFSTNFILNWYVEIRRIFFSLWAAAAAELAISHQWDQRIKSIEAQRARHQTSSRMNRTNRKHAVEELLLEIGYIVDCRKVWYAWTQCLFAKQAADELEEQQRRLKEEEEALCAEAIKKKSEVQLPMLEWVAQILGSSEGAMERKLPIILKEWSQGAKILKIERSRQTQRAVARDFAVYLISEMETTIDRTLLGKLVLSWHIDASLAHCEKEKAKAVERCAARELIASRLRWCVRAVTKLLEKREGVDLCAVVFIEWRRVVCVGSVARTGNEVRLALDDRIAAGRRTLNSEQALLEKSLMVSQWRNGGSIFISELLARLLFPAWRLYTADEHRKRSTLLGEEERFKQIEIMQQHALSYCSRSSTWAGQRCALVLDQHFAGVFFCAWRVHAFAQSTGQQRHGRANKFNIAGAKVISRSYKLRCRIFTEWHRVLRLEAKSSLEAHLRDLEDRFIRSRGEGGRGAAVSDLAEIEDASSSDESEDVSDSETPTSTSPGSSAHGSRAGRGSSPQGRLNAESIMRELNMRIRSALPVTEGADLSSHIRQSSPVVLQEASVNQPMPGPSPMFSSMRETLLDSTLPVSQPMQGSLPISLQVHSNSLLDSSPPVSLSPPRLILQPSLTGTTTVAQQTSTRQLPLVQEVLHANLPSSTMKASALYQQSPHNPFPYPWAQLPTVAAPSGNVTSSPVRVRTTLGGPRVVTTSTSSPTKLQNTSVGLGSPHINVAYVDRRASV